MYKLRMPSEGEGGKGMQLEINDMEKTALISVLENFIPELRGEIASGLKHNWRMELHRQEDILKEILERLKIHN